MAFDGTHIQAPTGFRVIATGKDVHSIITALAGTDAQRGRRRAVEMAAKAQRQREAVARQRITARIGLKLMSGEEWGVLTRAELAAMEAEGVL